MKLITDNPYRFLGVFSNSATRERVANSTKINALARRGNVSFPSDMDFLLSPITRDIDGLNKAKSLLDLPKNQLKYALFWFFKDGDTDIPLNNLVKGDKDKALRLFSMKHGYSSLVNRSVLSWIDGNKNAAVEFMASVFQDHTMLKDFVLSVCGSTFRITEDEIVELYVASLGEELDSKELNNAFASTKYASVVKQKTVGVQIDTINSEIAAAKNVDNKSAVQQLTAGTQLQNKTKQALREIKELLGESDTQYQLTADNLAKQILQCGINYYNDTSEDDDVSINKALVLQEYALSIAVGQLTKQRCQENVDILRRKKAELPPPAVKNEVKAIQSELTDFCRKPDLICHSVTLLNNCKANLQSIRTKLGATNKYYIDLSSNVLGNALHNIIEEVNSKQTALAKLFELIKDLDPTIRGMVLRGEIHVDPFDKLADTFQDLNSKYNACLRAAWNAIKIMDSFDKSSEFTTRYNENKNTLRNLCTQAGVSISSGRPSGGGTTTGGGGGDDTPWGCIIGIAIFIIFCLMTCN